MPEGTQRPGCPKGRGWGHRFLPGARGGARGGEGFLLRGSAASFSNRVLTQPERRRPATGPACLCCARWVSRVSGWEWRSPRRTGGRHASGRGVGALTAAGALLRTLGALRGPSRKIFAQEPRAPSSGRAELPTYQPSAASRLQGAQCAPGAPLRPEHGVALGRRSLGGGGGGGLASRLGAPRAGPLPPLVLPPRAASAPGPGCPPPVPPARPPRHAPGPPLSPARRRAPSGMECLDA